MPSIVRSLPALLLVLLVTRGAIAQDLPPSLAERFSQGVAALKTGELDNAEAAFREVLRRGGVRAFVHHNLGIVLQQRARHTEAVAEFRATIRLDPAFGPARLLAGTSLLALGRPKEAAAELERAVKLMPDEPLVHLQLADAYERTGNIAGLVDEYRRLVALAPQDHEYVYRLGKSYLRLAQFSYERIGALEPQSARLRQALGREYVAQGRLELAVRALEEAAALNPALPEIHLSLARIHLDQGRWDDAVREIDRELAIAPDSKEAKELKAAIDAARPR